MPGCLWVDDWDDLKLHRHQLQRAGSRWSRRPIYVNKIRLERCIPAHTLKHAAPTCCTPGETHLKWGHWSFDCNIPTDFRLLSELRWNSCNTVYTQVMSASLHLRRSLSQLLHHRAALAAAQLICMSSVLQMINCDGCLEARRQGKGRVSRGVFVSKNTVRDWGTFNSKSCSSIMSVITAEDDKRLDRLLLDSAVSTKTVSVGLLRCRFGLMFSLLTIKLCLFYLYFINLNHKQKKQIPFWRLMVFLACGKAVWPTSCY